ncbi:MAG: hypothetical protein HWQ38_28125 [Nostoc sp. NMS7]|nr:hypothetical protein [Nostoc sp. NMS7]MBN3950129.1 hypothetical protein [Nostoc sp. NMS7]
MTQNISYPLTWTTIYPRTPQHKQEAARFEVNFSTARNDLLNGSNAPK